MATVKIRRRLLNLPFTPSSSIPSHMSTIFGLSGIGDPSSFEQGETQPVGTTVEMPNLCPSELTQTQSPGRLGQFRIFLVKPLVPFLTLPYLRAKQILQLARTVSVFHMQSIYVSRQALHLVILLNEMVDANDGPDDKQHEESIVLEDDLIELSGTMKELAGADDTEVLLVASDPYERYRLSLERQYALFFKERSYFKETRDTATDSIYKRLLAYDEKTIQFRRCQRHQASSSTGPEYLSTPGAPPEMASTPIFVDHATRYAIGETVYVLITLPDRNLAGWTEGCVVSEEVWKHVIASNGEPSPRRFYVVKYGQNSAECHASPSHGNVLAREEWAKKLIRTRGGNWLDLDEL